MMKNYIIISIFILSFKVYSQSKDTIYFLINKKDTLIEKQLATKQNSYEGYLIIDEKRIKELKRTPLVEGKVWVPESEDDFYAFGPSFSFYRSEDTIVSKSYLNSLAIIRDRRAFLDDLSEHMPGFITYYFIEPKDGGEKFILRKVRPSIFE